jgi:hypothetical protein
MSNENLISRQVAIEALYKEIIKRRLLDDVNDGMLDEFDTEDILRKLPSAYPEEVIPHRNYKYLSDYWCECGWHLGKKGEVKYCSECGRKVNWDE